jgi:Uma2 family endonuclease
MKQQPLTMRCWTRGEYERLVELGVFHDEAVELIGGQLLVAEPQGSYHASRLGAAGDALRAALPPGWLVRVQMPVALDDDSEPEPDLAVVPGIWSDYEAGHPRNPALIVEVAESSLEFDRREKGSLPDRREKGSLYARGGVRDYWIVNLVERALEVYRDPEPDPAAPHGWRYRTIARITPPGVVAPRALPSARAAVGDLVP